MYDLRLITAIFLGKIVKFLIRKFSLGGATAAPGLIALKFDSKFVAKMSKNFPQGSIVITGTNGKTTTSRMLSCIFEQSAIKPLHNRAGSNLLRGIASTLLENSNFFGEIKNDLAIWETDEAVMPEAVRQVEPKLLLVNNLFRDQLDRYGEVDRLRKIWTDAVKKFGKYSFLILNSDDPQVAYLGKGTKAKVIYFGLCDPGWGTSQLPRIADARFCPYCRAPLNYQTVYVSHMGNYRCPKCIIKRPKPNIFAGKIHSLEEESAQFSLVTPVGETEIKLAVGGLYNIYNALAAASAAWALGINLKTIKAGLENFKAAFGRVEKFEVGGKILWLYLVKNPTGFNEVIKTLFATEEKKDVLIAINDLTADGKDISWLWDVDFEKLKGKTRNIFVTGIRAQDMALRLKYAEIKTPVPIENDLEKALKEAIKQSRERLFVLPTYTAMLEIRKILNKMGHGAKFWED
jgi:UDP-N-acetylmuramyl tripeptide synthase